jgi:electron transfer flavoprotein alpha subunit
MSTLLIAEHDGSTIKDATAKALTAAKALGVPVHVLVVGEGCKAAAGSAAKLDGVAKVLLADAPVFSHMLAEATAALVASLAAGYTNVVAASTANAQWPRASIRRTRIARDAAWSSTINTLHGAPTGRTGLDTRRVGVMTGMRPG